MNNVFLLGQFTEANQQRTSSAAHRLAYDRSITDVVLVTRGPGDALPVSRIHESGVCFRQQSLQEEQPLCGVPQTRVDGTGRPTMKSHQSDVEESNVAEASPLKPSGESSQCSLEVAP